MDRQEYQQKIPAIIIWPPHSQPTHSQDQIEYLFFKEQQGKIWLKDDSNSILLYLGIFHLYRTQLIDLYFDTCFIKHLFQRYSDNFLINFPTKQLNNIKCHFPNLVKKINQNIKKQTFISQVLTRNPQICVLLISIIRLRAIQYFQQNLQNYDEIKFGNQVDVLRNYSVEPRQTTLRIIVNSLQTHLILNFGKFSQNYGHGKYEIEMTAKCLDQNRYYCFCEKQKVVKERIIKDSILKESISKLNLSTIKGKGLNNSLLNSKDEQYSICITNKSKRWKRNSNSKQKQNEKCKICYKKNYFCSCKQTNDNPFKLLLPTQQLCSTYSNQKLARKNTRHNRFDSLNNNTWFEGQIIDQTTIQPVLSSRRLKLR